MIRRLKRKLILFFYQPEISFRKFRRSISSSTSIKFENNEIFKDRLNIISTYFNFNRVEHLIKENIYYKLKYFFQRNIRGYDDLMKWNLDEAVIDLSLPILKYYKNSKTGYPNNFKSFEEFEKVLDEIIEGFELFKKDFEGSIETIKQEDFIIINKKIKRSCQLFGKYLLNFWD